jgi:hypothetical protein
MSAMRSLLGVLLAAQLAASPARAGELVEPVAGTPAPSPAPAPAPAYHLPASDDVKVDIDANFPSVGLESNEVGAPRCLAPCGKSFSRDGYYRIKGEGLIPSAVFQLPARANQVTLDVQAGTKSQETVGAAMGIGGLALTGVAIGYALDVVVINIDGPPATTTQRGIIFGGIVGGLAVSVVGVLLYLTAGTRVRGKGAPLRFGPFAP